LQPEISIIVPIYNVEEFLNKCINSILAQTFKNFELILVNDGSTDRSGEICNYYAEKDHRITVIHKENGGVSSARNIGINLAIGKYIAFVDPDDTIESQMYEELLKAAKKHNADVVVCPIKSINTKNLSVSVSSIWRDVNNPLTKKIIENELIPSILIDKNYSLVSSVNKLYRKSIVNLINLTFEEHKDHSEDARFNFTLLTSINRLVYVDKPLYNYYIRNRDSLSRTFREDFHTYIIDNKKFLIKLCETYKYEKYVEIIRAKYTTFILSHMQDVVRKDMGRYSKYKIVSQILNNNEFREDILMYKGNTNFLRLLKYLCIIKNERIIVNVIASKIVLQNYLIKVKSLI
jgi:glycosyltransferase involved in cell wall biosynthesis